MRQEELSEIHRQWLLTAVMKVSAEQGVSSLTAAKIADRAGVSKRAFHARFDDCEACLLAAIQQAVARISGVVGPAYRSHERWREQIRAGLSALLTAFEREPSVARLCVVDSLAGGPAILQYRTAVLAQLISAVDEGRRLAGPEFDPPTVAAEGVVGAALHMLHSRFTDRSPAKSSAEPLSALVSPMMSMIVLPYLGERVASEELRIQVLPVANNHIEPFASLRSETFGDTTLRLTYRTMRVLRAVESSPGSSNREIAGVAGVSDPGQISKLLARLSALGVIDNATLVRSNGASNVWRLTDRGERFMRSIATAGAQTDPHERVRRDD